VNDQSMWRAARARHAEEQEGAYPGLEVRLDLAQERIRGLLAHAREAGNRRGLARLLGDEAGLDELVEAELHLARECADALVLTEPPQADGV
jgi:hypothetical protein